MLGVIRASSSNLRSQCCSRSCSQRSNHRSHRGTTTQCTTSCFPPTATTPSAPSRGSLGRGEPPLTPSTLRPLRASRSFVSKRHLLLSLATPRWSRSCNIPRREYYRVELGSTSSKRRIPTAQKYDYASRTNTPVAASEAPGPKTSNASSRLSSKLASDSNESLDNRLGVSQNVANVEVGAQTYVAHFARRREHALSR